jgi:hypothetical protein
LFDALVRPVLLYAAQILVPAIGSKFIEKIEAFHLSFLRSQLRVSRGTPTDIIYLETAQYPLRITCLGIVYRNLERMITLDATRLTARVLLDDWTCQNRLGHSSWLRRAVCILSGFAVNANGCDPNFLIPPWCRNPKDAFAFIGLGDTDALRSSFVLDALSKHRRGPSYSPRMSHYVRATASSHIEQYNPCHQGVETQLCSLHVPHYLQRCGVSRRHCELITRFRCSDHPLGVEVGRRAPNGQYIPLHERLCPCCGLTVETESHFLFDCPTYNDLRSEFWTLFRPYIPGRGTFSHTGPWADRIARLLSLNPSHVGAYLERAYTLRQPFAERVVWLCTS